MKLVHMKAIIHNKCLEILEDRISSMQRELEELRKSQSSEMKSSMGDKYETAREMINLEKGKLAEQLSSCQKMMSFLSQLNPTRKLTTVEAGALISTRQGKFYLSVSLGKVAVGPSDEVFVVSPVSPIGQAMLGKKKGENFTLNSTSQQIFSIE